MNQPAIPRPATIPLPALLLGAGGLTPFAGLTAGIVLYPDPNLSYFLGWLVQYGALIASFTGALQWGLAMQTVDAPEPENGLHSAGASARR